MKQADKAEHAAELNALIKDAGYSDTEIGAMCGVSAMTIWNWRRGKYAVRKYAFDRIRELCSRRIKTRSNGARPHSR